MNKNTIVTFVMIFSMIFSSCEEVASNRRVSLNGDQIQGGTGGGTTIGGGAGGGNFVNPVEQALNDAESVEAPTVELRHLIEPKVDDNSEGGTYLKKLTLPKNYNGLLYLAGINISTLTEHNVKVRFRFGIDGIPIDVPATVSTASGLTPQTDVEVLVMDLRSKPFEDIQLIYDLFDYNDYDFTGSNEDKLAEPVQYNRNKHLFCRGLTLKDDPTFNGNIEDGCTGSSDVCKYAYAKIVDQGLVHYDSSSTVYTPITPSEANIQSGTSSYLEDIDSIKLSRCLADDPTLTYSNQTTMLYQYALSKQFTYYYDQEVINSETYFYKGPYRITNTSMWEISDDAISNSMFGLYQTFNYASLINYPVYYNSKLFPLYTKFDLLKDTEYMGAATPDGEKTLQEMVANGESIWMDGCNARATSVDNLTGEHVGSCNVTASISIVQIDDDGKETEKVVSQDVKLQLVKPATLNTSGDNVLLSSFQSCSSSSQCGSDECCVSNRCWSKAIVSQCVEDMPAYGLLEPGSACTSDHECASLCCSQTTGRCAVHDTLQDPPVYCSKASGQRCIAKEWCMKHPVTRCYIIKTGFDAQGAVTCALRCYTFEEHGDCENGICKPPPQPDMPTFDPNDLNKCSTACDPPDFSNGYFDFKCGK